MERTKKLIVLMLAICMVLCFGLSGCGSDGGSTDPGTDQQENSQPETSSEAPEIKGLTFEIGRAHV